jgi:hypothetical protein
MVGTAFHIHTLPSVEPAAITFPFGCHSNHSISCVGPSRVATSTPSDVLCTYEKVHCVML